MAGRALRNDEIPAWIERHRGLPLTERVDCATSAFLGTPYEADPVGDGPESEFDRRPSLRLDRFDCQTYVETATAMSFARSAGELAEIVRRLRYRKGYVGFATRNHFSVLQWIPNNVATGLLCDITVDVAGGAPVEFERRHGNIERWFRSLGPERLRGLDSEAVTQEENVGRLRQAWIGPSQVEVEISWLPMRSLFRPERPFPDGRRFRGLEINTPAFDQLPTGAILVFRSTLHMGIAVRRSDGLYLRHASSRRGRVTEQELLTLLMSIDPFSSYEGVIVLRPLLGGVALPGMPDRGEVSGLRGGSRIPALG